MARPLRIRHSGAKYHVTVRGNGRDQVFFEDDYYKRFLQQLESALAQDGVLLYAYVLMPNHYHLFVETPFGNIQRFMQRLNTAYSMYFRYKHNRPGHCFQGRYSAKLVSGDDYIIRLTRYIHLNPVKTKRYEESGVEAKRKALNAYQWSSYLSYAGFRNEEEMLDYRWLGLMKRKTRKGMQQTYRGYIERMLKSDDEALIEALSQSRYAIGEESFCEQVDAQVEEAKRSKAVDGDIHWPKTKTVSADQILDLVAKHGKVSREDLASSSRSVLTAKRLAIELVCLYSGLKQREVYPLFGYRSESSITKQRQAFSRMLTEDQALAKSFEKLKNMLPDSRFKV